jgi:DNA-binding SARP family transcriptional activator
MQLETLTDLNHHTIEAQIEDRRLILLAPRFRNRNALTAYFMESGTGAYFYALSPEDTTLQAFLKNLVDTLRDVDPKFGRQISQALDQANVSPADLADALLYDLGKARPKPHTLLLDEFDNLAQGDDVNAFFEQFVLHLPDDLRLVINSRQLDYQPWSRFVRSGDAVVLGAEQVLDGTIFSPDVPEMPHLEVYGFGAGSVLINGRLVETWDGPLPRNLFYYFVDHPMVTRDEIFETFWPDLPTKEATNVFHVTKRKVSERLGYELTGYSGGFYRPSGQMSVHYDVACFEEAVKGGREAQVPTTPEIWYKAIRLYRSQFLQNIEMPWIVRRREELKLTYAEALIGVGRLYKALGDTEGAISYYLRALREVPHREDIHRDVMSLYESRGERDKAIAQYQVLSDNLKRTLNITPSKATRTLYNLLIGEGND